MNTLDFDNGFSVHQEHQLCAFADCQRPAQLSKQSLIIPHFGDDGLLIPGSDLVHHACCSRKHEMCFLWRINNDICIHCGTSGSLLGWCCGKPECKKIILNKMYMNHILRYYIHRKKCVAL